jgi:hypothetical protein
MTVLNTEHIITGNVSTCRRVDGCVELLVDVSQAVVGLQQQQQLGGQSALWVGRKRR